jgi:hypothetical protein
VIFRQVESDAVLLDTRRGFYFSLNETGTLLWRALDPGPASMADLEATLTRAFGGAPAPLRADLEAWVLDLERNDLLEIV